jgi:lipopolysaccharide/colanic/teichoic acid biosynthesis glycosyltransferase
MYKVLMKRFLDLIITFVALIVLSSVLVVITVILSIQNKGTPFFLQTRPGNDQKPFKIIKFKTMTDEKDKEGNLLPDHQRLTTFGKAIRKLSIDELPQLINVFKGDMSLVGPRPLLFKYR